jgi:hypothetical protein
MTFSIEKKEFPDLLLNSLPASGSVSFDADVHTVPPSFVGSENTTGPRITEPTVFYLRQDQLDYLAHDMNVATPEDEIDPGRHYTRFELLQLVLAYSVGRPMSIADIRGGAVVQDIIPKESKRNVADSSHGSAKEFSFHNDMSYLEDAQIPDYFLLGCIRNIEKAATTISDPTVALRDIDAGNIDELKKTQYVFRHTYHRGTEDERLGEKVSPIITANGEIRLGVDMRAPTSAALTALTDFREKLSGVSVEHVLKSGEVLVVPNRLFVHGRQPFLMAGNPAERRWIQRINISSERNLLDA